VYDNLTCSISTRLNGPGKTWKTDKWPLKVLENAHKKVLGSRGKPLQCSVRTLLPAHFFFLIKFISLTIFALNLIIVVD